MKVCKITPGITMSIMMLLFTALVSFSAAKTLKDDLESAKKAKKSVFLVVTGNGISPAKALEIAKAAQQKTKGSIVLSLNRDDAANKELVSEFSLGSVPLPMILVIGMNGIPAGGLQESEATTEKLTAMVPSAKKAEALALLENKKPVFIIVSKKSFADRSSVVKNCQDAIQLMKGNGGIVEVDMDDPAEKSLLKQINADLKSGKTQILVFNAQGKQIGNYPSNTDSGKLMSAATSNPKSSCCPPGSGKTCAK